ncbi:hypothetical protein RsTz2092_12450 [Deferribacterales bacterium RsTz2092]|nr:hypothetical protein AGMMS49941_11600 [Deferribacterales bacterium]
MKLFSTVIKVAIVAYVVLFVVWNSDIVTITAVGEPFPQVSYETKTFIVGVGAFLLGAILVAIYFMTKNWSVSSNMKKLRRELELANAKLSAISEQAAPASKGANKLTDDESK